MMRTTARLAMGCLLLCGAAGCGDDDGGTDSGVGDAGTTPCPRGMDIPQPEGLMVPCCYRKSNAMNLDAPELRIAGVNITEPASLGNVVVRGLLAGALDEERFNWLLRITGAAADGDVTVTTGFGQRSVSGSNVSFAFVNGAAPMPGDVNRWNPVTFTGTLAGETVSAPRLDGSFTVPIFEEDGTTLVLELPLNNLELIMATMSEDRTCVGTRRASSYDTAAGHLTAYITVLDADMGRLKTGCDEMNMNCTLDTTLCMFTAGMSTMPDTCAEYPDHSMWPLPPDSLCGTAGCQRDPGDGSICDPGTTCDAWFVDAAFAAQGVEIAD